MTWSGYRQPVPSRFRLRVGLEDKGRFAIQVADNGLGIIDEALGKIFMSFFPKKKEGSGSGLSLSRQIMRLLMDSIAAHSKPNEEISLP